MRTFPILLLAAAVAACGCTGERGVGTSESSRTGDREQVEMPVDKTPCGDPGLSGEAEEKAPPPEQAGKTLGPAIIDFEEVDRLIPLLDSDDYQERKRAKEKLITIGRKSALHAETLGPYLFKRSEQEDSLRVRACLSEILYRLSSVSVSLVRSRTFPCSCKWSPDGASFLSARVFDTEVDFRYGFFCRYPHSKLSDLDLDFEKRFVLDVIIGPCPDRPIKIRVEHLDLDIEEQLLETIRRIQPFGFRLVSVGRDFSSLVIAVGVEAFSTSMEPPEPDRIVYPESADATGLIAIDRTSYPILVYNVRYSDSLSEPVEGVIKSVSLVVSPWPAKQLVKGEQTVEELKKLLGHENYFVRRDAVRALGRIGTPGAISAIIEHLKSEKHGLVKRWCAIVLGRAGAKEAIPALEAIFKPERQNAAVAFSEYVFWALIKLKAESVGKIDAYDGYVGDFYNVLRRAGYYPEADRDPDIVPDEITDAEFLAMLRRAADEFEARYLKETQASSGK